MMARFTVVCCDSAALATNMNVSAHMPTNVNPSMTVAIVDGPTLPPSLGYKHRGPLCQQWPPDHKTLLLRGKKDRHIVSFPLFYMDGCNPSSFGSMWEWYQLCETPHQTKVSPNDHGYGDGKHHNRDLSRLVGLLRKENRHRDMKHLMSSSTTPMNTPK